MSCDGYTLQALSDQGGQIRFLSRVNTRRSWVLHCRYCMVFRAHALLFVLYVAERLLFSRRHRRIQYCTSENEILHESYISPALQQKGKLPGTNYNYFIAYCMMCMEMVVNNSICYSL